MLHCHPAHHGAPFASARPQRTIYHAGHTVVMFRNQSFIVLLRADDSRPPSGARAFSSGWVLRRAAFSGQA